MIDLPVLDEPSRYKHSFTSINTFANICEYRYAFEKLKPWTDSEASLRGKHIHDAMELWARQDFDPYTYTALNATPGALSDEVLFAWLDNVKELALGLNPIKAEYWVRSELGGCKYPLVGKVDLLSANGPDGKNEPCIIDWKSVSSMKKKLTQRECDLSLQGRIYSKVTGVRRVAFVYFTLNHEAEYVLSEYSDTDIRETWEFVEHTAQQIERRWETGHWRKSHPGGLCSPRWCESFSACYPSDA